jgi:hypothetical protein
VKIENVEQEIQKNTNYWYFTSTLNYLELNHGCPYKTAARGHSLSVQSLTGTLVLDNVY